jgi:hypothetical protein
MNLNTCVDPSGTFVYAVHKPRFRVENFREADWLMALGRTADGREVHNHQNFPPGAVDEPAGDWIFEIPNAFAFKGTTYIARRWAEKAAKCPTDIALPEPGAVSLTQGVEPCLGAAGGKTLDDVFAALPDPLKLALAQTSTDPADLVRLAEGCCAFSHDPENGMPTGLIYEGGKEGRLHPKISNPVLFEVLGNNGYLPDAYKAAMMLRPGVQGNSEIVGEFTHGPGHVFEYLRRNSYIPWGHYAANMAHDAVRYRVPDLTLADVTGMRHLYYQRTYARLAAELAVKLPTRRRLEASELETLRCRILDILAAQGPKRLSFTSTLWGWNFGFDYAPSHFRLHASHQQVHQQYAMVPAGVEQAGHISFKPFACGDMIASFIAQYRQETGKPFFDTYLKALDANVRMDGCGRGPTSLVVYQDADVLVFVPKAQTSQWELQLMAKKPVGNILEADSSMRAALDRGLRVATGVLAELGATMITCIEYGKRFDNPDTDQRLLYAFLPRLPESPGAFSEAQLRWINGHYPEDFAESCRLRLSGALAVMSAV